MKALLDQNLSYRLVDVFSERFPGSGHVRDHGLTAHLDDIERFVANSQESVFLLRG